MQNEKDTVIYRFNDRLTVTQDPLNFVVRRGKGSDKGAGESSYFRNLSDAFEDVYDERVKLALGPDECKNLLEVVTRVTKATEEMKKFIIDNVK